MNSMRLNTVQLSFRLLLVACGYFWLLQPISSFIVAATTNSLLQSSFIPRTVESRILLEDPPLLWSAWLLLPISSFNQFTFPLLSFNGKTKIEDECSNVMARRCGMWEGCGTHIIGGELQSFQLNLMILPAAKV